MSVWSAGPTPTANTKNARNVAMWTMVVSFSHPVRESGQGVAGCWKSEAVSARNLALSSADLAFQVCDSRRRG